MQTTARMAAGGRKGRRAGRSDGDQRVGALRKVIHRLGIEFALQWETPRYSAVVGRHASRVIVGAPRAL